MIIIGAEAAQLFKKIKVRYPGNCSHCRTRFRAAEEVKLSRKKLYCKRHAPEDSISVLVPTRREMK